MTPEHEIAIANFQALFGGRSRRQREDDEWLVQKLHELFAGQKLLEQTIDALAKRVQQLADRLDGSSTTRHGSPVTTTQTREQRQRDHRLLSRGAMPSSHYRRKFDR